VQKPAGKQEAKNQIRKILDVLSRHGEVISDAVEGTVEMGDKGYNAAIDALVGINALMPFEEGQYQLNPRIRTYLSEQLAQYSAFQTLTRITEQIHGAQTKWREIVLAKETGDLRDMAALEESLGYTVNEIVHFTAQNLLLLNTQISTDYGNVETLKRKLAQNAFYGDGVKTLLSELQQLDAFTNLIDREALGKGLTDIRHLINSRIRSRLSDWMTRLNNIQATITKRLFEARKLDRDLMYLSKVVLWLARNPTRVGIDLDVPDSVNVALLRPVAIRVRTQFDVSDVQINNQQVLVNAVGRLGAPPNPWEQRTDESKLQFVVQQDMVEISEPIRDEDLLINEIVEALHLVDAQPVSVFGWQTARREALGLDHAAWLLYAASQIDLLGLRTEFCLGVRGATDFNDVFEDVIAHPPNAMRQQAAHLQ
jgi:hypothetical protein